MMDRIGKLFVAGAALLVAALLLAEESPSPSSGGIELTAISANVSGAPDELRFEIVRWSTDEERDRLMKAWDLEVVPPDPNAKGPGRLSKGKAKGKGEGPEPEPVTPDVALNRALQESPTVGYLWSSSELAGYALRYAGTVEDPDGSQRILLITQRPLGDVNQRWNADMKGEANSYPFSVIELRLDANGTGEGKASLVGHVAGNPGAGIVALENYDALPVVFANVGPAKQP